MCFLVNIGFKFKLQMWKIPELTETTSCKNVTCILSSIYLYLSIYNRLWDACHFRGLLEQALGVEEQVRNRDCGAVAERALEGGGRKERRQGTGWVTKGNM